MRTRSQRLLSMVLALSMLLTFLPVSAFADDPPLPIMVRRRLIATIPAILIQTAAIMKIIPISTL